MFDAEVALGEMKNPTINSGRKGILDVAGVRAPFNPSRQELAPKEENAEVLGGPNYRVPLKLENSVVRLGFSEPPAKEADLVL